MREFTLSLKGGAQEKMGAIRDLIVQLMQAGHPVVVTVAEFSKSRAQERLYHALIGEISKQVKVVKAFYEPEIWKAQMIYQFAKERELMGMPLRKPGRVIPAFDGSGDLITVRPSTRDFTREEAASFIDYLYSEGIEMGVKWPAKADEIAASEREWLANNREAA